MLQTMEVRKGNQRHHTILIVDSDPYNREKLAAILRKKIGCSVLGAETIDGALKILANEKISLLIAECLSHENGVEFLKKCQEEFPQVVNIVGIPENGHYTLNEVAQYGAYMLYTRTPYNFSEMGDIALKGLAHYDKLQGRNGKETTFHEKNGFYNMVGKSFKMRTLFDRIAKVAAADTCTVLLQGESGTGKELVARAIHLLSSRRKKNLVPVNSAAIPDDLLESELFGHEKGAFTGAVKAKMGRVQYAEGGTLFLDEIGDMKPAMQAKLLRLLQEKEYEPVGGLKPIKADVRIIAATHRDLEERIREGKFREDLYYRLNVIPFYIPPLRERVEDIPLLMDNFVKKLSRDNIDRILGFEPDVYEVLMGYDWPGNVRELENLVQRLSVLCGGQMIRVDDLPEQYCRHFKKTKPAAKQDPIVYPREINWNDGNVDFKTLTNDFENKLIVKALFMAKGNKKEAARLLNLKRTTLIEKIKKKKIDFPPDLQVRLT
jgi:DNA-binding NtrC family response regulator